jgi:hypothetical protein
LRGPNPLYALLSNLFMIGYSLGRFCNYFYINALPSRLDLQESVKHKLVKKV